MSSYQGNAGTIITVDCASDVSAAITAYLRVTKPSGRREYWPASVVSVNSVPNFLRYTTVVGDLDEAGHYEIQPYVVLPGFKGYCDAARFEIKPILGSVFVRCAPAIANASASEVTV
jgi:hypothetical protein